MRASTWLVTLIAVSLVCCDAPPPSPAAQSVLSRAGPLPVRGTFTTASEHQLMILSGSAWTDETEVDVVVDVLVDGSLVARGGIFSNAPGTSLGSSMAPQDGSFSAIALARVVIAAQHLRRLDGCTGTPRAAPAPV